MTTEQSCIYCGTVLNSSMPKIKCTDCSKLGTTDAFQLCLGCFSCGVEIGSHKNTHRYTVEYGAPPGGGGGVRLFEGGEDWKGDEDDALLDGIESHGFGNWEAVKFHVPSKSAEDCERRYTKYFVDGAIGQATQQTSAPLPVIDDTLFYNLLEDVLHAVGDLLDFIKCDLKRENLAVKYTRLMKVPELSVQDQIELGFMALRDDFIIEFDSEYESAISDLSIDYFDTHLDTAYKVFRVDQYRHLLRQRIAKKEIAKRFNIYHRATSSGMKALSASKRKTTKEERTFEIAMKVFGKFTYRADILKLFHTTQRQLRLMKQIKMLQKFSDKGHKSLTGKLKMHAVQMNGKMNSKLKKRKKKSRFSYYK